MTENDPRECSECGHDIFEMHDPLGCHMDECRCTVKWSRAEKRKYAKQERIKL